MSGLVQTVSHNYATYYECKSVVEGWQEWYIDTKKLYNTVVE